MVEFLEILVIFLAVSLLVTYLIKRFTKHDTHLLISIIKTKKPLWVFDALSKHKKFLDVFATIGLILGFGEFAIDFLYG